MESGFEMFYGRKNMKRMKRILRKIFVKVMCKLLTIKKSEKDKKILKKQGVKRVFGLYEN